MKCNNSNKNETKDKEKEELIKRFREIQKEEEKEK
jgi:hypothetical protein